MRVVASVLFGFAVLLLSASAYAQGAIAGLVRDTSGAVLPGVTVEASSPALIEKTRTAVSDGSGQYRIENLRPGLYTVRFELAGFNQVSREGVELSGSATVSVNADLRVGALEETVTVTGESPVVDLQSAERQTVLTNEVIKAIPTAGSYNALLVLVPGLLGGQQDVSTGPCNSCTFSAHGTLLSLGGNRANTDARLLVDGISIAVPQAGGTNYLTDTRNAQEVTFTVSGSMGEVESGGPVMNIIPRSGGNTMSANGFVSWANGDMQGSNLSDELKALRITPSPLIKSYDLSGAVGGPISKDRAWFFATVRGQGNSQYITNMYHNKNAGDPNKWLYDPDLSRQAFNDKTWQNASGRITAQITPRNKLNVFWDEQSVCAKCENGGNYANATTSPEANGYGDLTPMRFQQATWTSPVNNKLLLEGGFGYFFSRWGGRAKENPNTESLQRIIEQCAAGCPANGNIPNLMYRSQTTDLFSDGRNKNITTTWRATAAYVTGGSSFRFGYIGNQLGDIRSANRGANDLRYRVNNGVPNQLTEYVHNQQNDLWMRNNAFYAQQQWTRGRLTLQGALRYDRATSWAPEQQLESRFWAAPLVFEATPVVNAYNDLTPRAAVAYDLFGNGKTALKATLGKYPRVDRDRLELRPRQPDVANRHQRHAYLDRPQRQLDARLQPQQPADAGLRPGRRLLRRDLEPELRHGDVQQHHRSRHPAGLGRSAVRLELGRVGAARIAAAHVGRGGLLPSRVLRLRGHRQPGGDPVRLHPVLDSGAAGSASARRWWLPGRPPVRPQQPGALRRHPQLHHLQRQLRGCLPEVQRDRHHLQRRGPETASRSRAASRGDTRPPTTARFGRRCRRSDC